MKLDTKSLIAGILVSLLAAACSSESGDESKNGKKQQATSDVTFYFGARVIPGDGSPVIEDATFIVSNGKFTAVGKKGEVTPPKGSGRIDLTGRTITPVFFNVQAQFSRIRGYAEVAPEAVRAAADAIYRKQLQITNWLLDMPGSERYFGDKSGLFREAVRKAGSDNILAKELDVGRASHEDVEDYLADVPVAEIAAARGCVASYPTTLARRYGIARRTGLRGRVRAALLQEQEADHA